MKRELLTNDNTTCIPRISPEGPALTFDFPGLQVGVAEYEEGPTGCTVFHFNEVENPDLGEIALGVLPSELAWDAVLSCLTEKGQ
jgi:hypothetical protein